MLALYIATRANRLRLNEDPRFTNPQYGWGWLEMVAILRRAYGYYLGHLVGRKLLAQLHDIVNFTPAVTDSRMGPDEWINTENGAFKIDFEQHAFGAPELDIVDAAYDLAGATFEFQLSDEAEEQLLYTYGKTSGDNLVGDRLLLYKLLYGTVVMRKAAEGVQRLSRRRVREDGNERYIRARSFLTHTLNQFTASALPHPLKAEWMDKIFFLDLDGVFDGEVLGFPHTTLSGIQSLACLAVNGWSVVLNTGRSIEQVRSYCASYGLPGGVAEYGSVFVDNVQHRELPLINSKGYTELERCRAALTELPDVFIDPEYRYSVRAYRFNGHRTAGLSYEEVADVLSRHDLGMLTIIPRNEDTTIVQRGTGKGAGVRFVKDYLQSSPNVVVVIGDSDEDIDMMKEADIVFAPRNCSAEIRYLAKAVGWKVLRRSRQKGLLQAVKSINDLRRVKRYDFLTSPGDGYPVKKLMFKLIEVAEKPRLLRILY